MGWNEPDVYNQPEHYGLKTIGDIEWDHESWQFNMTVILRGNDGQWYYAEDSGCSCPSPFENVTSMDDLTKVTVDELIKYLTDRRDERVKSLDDSWYTHNPSDDVAKLIERILKEHNTIDGDVVPTATKEIEA